MICRAAVGAEVAPVDPNCAGQAQIFVGFPVFIDVARPGCRGSVSGDPAEYAGRLGLHGADEHAAQPGERHVSCSTSGRRIAKGNTKLLGTRTITCDNAHATKPFGAIDTPEQGGVASGGLCQLRVGADAAAEDDSDRRLDDHRARRRRVGRDGELQPLPLGHRGAFPGCNNTNGAIGFRVIDTTTLANGTHTIVVGRERQPGSERRESGVVSSRCRMVRRR